MQLMSAEKVIVEKLLNLFTSPSHEFHFCTKLWQAVSVRVLISIGINEQYKYPYICHKSIQEIGFKYFLYLLLYIFTKAKMTR